MTTIFTAPIHEIELPTSKAKVSFKGWLTKQESDAVKEPMRRHDVEVNDKHTIQRFAASIMQEVEHKTIEAAVVSVTIGETTHTDKLLEICLSLPETDYDFLKEKIDDTLSPPKGQKA